MNRVFPIWVILWMGLWASCSWAAQSQKNTFIRIQGHSDLQSAIEQAQSFSRYLPQISVHEILGHWFAVVMGPFEKNRAEMIEQWLKLRGHIQRDGFLVHQKHLVAQAWPPSKKMLAKKIQDLRKEQQQNTYAQPTVKEVVATLPRTISKDLQEMLKTLDLYTGKVDGIHATATQNAIVRWQKRNGFFPNGLLPQKQIEILHLEIALRDEAAKTQNVPSGPPKHSWTGVFLNAQGDVLTARDPQLGCTFWAIDRFWPVLPLPDQAMEEVQILRPTWALFAPPDYASVSSETLARFEGLILYGFSMGHANMIAVPQKAVVTSSTMPDGKASAQVNVLSGDTGAPLFDISNQLRAISIPSQNAFKRGTQEVPIIDVAQITPWLRKLGVIDNKMVEAERQDVIVENVVTSVECW